MTLDQYLDLKKITAAEFGAKCEPPISEASISRIRKGKQNISRDTMLSIIAASDGMVTADGLIRLQDAA
jgi:hypothetical protein